MVGAGRARDLPAIIDSLVVKRPLPQKQGGRRGAVGHRADRRPARPASPRRSSKATGKQVEVKVVVDPSVMGGLVTSVGDIVIDGTVADRLNQLKSLL